MPGKKCTRCTICNKEINTLYISRTKTYLNITLIGKHYLCSPACQYKFNNTMRCRMCNYHSELVDTKKGFMVCNQQETTGHTCYDIYQNGLMDSPMRELV